MFSSLKTKNPRTSVFKNSPSYPGSYSKSPGVTYSSVKPNEKDRLVRCKVCGFICDRDKCASLRYGSHAGIGVKYASVATASACVSDAMIPAAGTVTRTPDNYYTRTVKGGCPCCGSFLFDA